MNIAVYTAITGGYEPDRDDIIVFGEYKEFCSDRRNAKIYKVLSHLFLHEDITIWLDGNISFAPGVDIQEFVKEFLEDSDIAFFHHPCRYNLKDEAEECIRIGLDNETIIRNQVANYYQEGPMPKILFAAGVIVRRNNERVRRFNEMWWAHICRYSSRDQISLPYVLLKTDVYWRAHVGYVTTDPRFIYRKHKAV